MGILNSEYAVCKFEGLKKGCVTKIKIKENYKKLKGIQIGFQIKQIIFYNGLWYNKTQVGVKVDNLVYMKLEFVI